MHLCMAMRYGTPNPSAQNNVPYNQWNRSWRCAPAAHSYALSRQTHRLDACTMTAHCTRVLCHSSLHSTMHPASCIQPTTSIQFHSAHKQAHATAVAYAETYMHACCTIISAPLNAHISVTNTTPAPSALHAVTTTRDLDDDHMHACSGSATHLSTPFSR